MSKSRGEIAIEQLAAQKNISVEEIRREIGLAIDEAIANKEPEVHKQWAEILKYGQKPTPEEFIEYMADKALSQLYKE